MQTMIKYDPQEFKKIQELFPNLFYDKRDNSINGELDFYARYQKNDKKNRKINWEIVLFSAGNDCFHGYYEIKILLSNAQHGWPEVFETSGKIKKIAQETNKEEIDLHLYPSDGSCCLGICINPNISLSAFIFNIVCPYFVWQAYFSKYRDIPPCGEYSHDTNVKQEFSQDLDNRGRNELCICGSGKKYKKCCLPNKETIKNKLIVGRPEKAKRLIESESARRLARLGGSEPQLQSPPRRRPAG